MILLNNDIQNYILSYLSIFDIINNNILINNDFYKKLSIKDNFFYLNYLLEKI